MPKVKTIVVSATVSMFVRGLFLWTLTNSDWVLGHSPCLVSSILGFRIIIIRTTKFPKERGLASLMGVEPLDRSYPF